MPYIDLKTDLGCPDPDFYMAAIKPIHYSKLARVFELDGWAHSRTKGDHISMTKARL